MGKQALKSIHALIKMAVKETPIEQQFLQDLKASIEKMDACNSRPPSKSYKPSSMACIRNMYFQVTGAERDEERSNYCLVGICESGTDRHERIQRAVSQMQAIGIDCEYVDVAQFVQERELNYLQVRGKSGFETKLYYPELNISFLCDGIIKYKGKYYILEIKTESIYKWQSREFVADDHLNQATTYSICLGLDDVLFLYENRDNCDKKAYILHVTEDMKAELLKKVEECDTHVSNLIPPPKPADVPKKACAYCSYKTVCKKAGK